jgi:hypothetical protein
MKHIPDHIFGDVVCAGTHPSSFNRGGAMRMAIACGILGFFAGIVFAVLFPLGLYFRRLVFRLRGPAPMEADAETILIGPEDVLEWDMAAKRPRKARGCQSRIDSRRYSTTLVGETADKAATFVAQLLLFTDGRSWCRLFGPAL